MNKVDLVLANFIADTFEDEETLAYALEIVKLKRMRQNRKAKK